MPHNSQQQNHLQAGPAYNSGGSVDRVRSYDSSTVKSEKRRSGFFGFGKKDKDKERDVKGDKDKEVSWDLVRRGLSVGGRV